MTALSALSRSRALWNRATISLESDEILAQLLDRGSLEDFRALYELAARDPALRRRMRDIVSRVPLIAPYFWLAALASLGEPAFDCKPPSYTEQDV